jgi:hypothetical protein
MQIDYTRPDYAAIYKRVLGEAPWDPRIARRGYTGLDRLAREKLLEADVGDEATEAQYEAALRRVVRELVSDTPEVPLTAGVIDVRAAEQAGEPVFSVNGVVRTKREARQRDLSGFRLSGLSTAAAAASILAERGLTAESASAAEYSAAIGEAAVLSGYGRNGDTEPDPSERMSPQERAWRRENIIAETAEQQCQAAGDTSYAGFLQRYRDLLQEVGNA